MQPAQPQPATGQPAKAPPRSLGARLPGYVVRLVLIGLIAWIGWSAATTLSEVISGPRPTDVPLKPAPTAASEVLGMLSPTGGGCWSFADTPLNFEIVHLSGEPLTARLRKSPSTDNGEGGRELFALLRSMKVPRLPYTADGGIYLLDRGGFKAVVFTRGTGAEERPIAARFALPFGEQDWMLLETGAAPARSTVQDSATLLPLPTGTQRLARRCDEQGRLVAEVVAVQDTLPRLQESWEQHGWSVARSPGAGELGVHCTCVRGADSVQVLTRSDSADAGQQVLVFVKIVRSQVKE